MHQLIETTLQHDIDAGHSFKPFIQRELKNPADYYDSALELQFVYPEGHELRNVVLYDITAGKYYNRPSDLYLIDGDSLIP